jgi:putative Mg2+ transporter-C (MgtC) family protein
MPAFLTHPLEELIPFPWVHILLALAAAICGGIVGTEREKREKPAGLRTLVLVCLGSAAFTMASYAFNTTTGDSGRVAAQIVSGIGFLGAGAILHGSGLITGMTTAATIWVMAAIGMIVGTGYAIPGLALSFFVRFLLTTIYRWETRYLRRQPTCTVHFLFDPARGKTRIRIEKILEERDLKVPAYSAPNSDGQISATIHSSLPSRQHNDLLCSLADIPEIVEIDSEDSR